LQTLDQAGIACQGKAVAHQEKLVTYTHKKFYSIGPWLNKALGKELGILFLQVREEHAYHTPILQER
jgi:hypothetical protein